MRRICARVLRISCFALAVSAFVFARGAAASIPDSSGIFHACLKKDGNIRIINAPIATCKAKDETPISWSAPLRVVDSQNQTVGLSVGEFAVRQISGQTEGIPLVG